MRHDVPEPETIFFEMLVLSDVRFGGSEVKVGLPIVDSSKAAGPSRGNV